MTFAYPAIFRQKEDGRWKGFFPDLADCDVEGDDLDEALRFAIEEERAWISTELEDDWDLPEVSDPRDLPVQEGDVVRTIACKVRLTEGWDE